MPRAGIALGSNVGDRLANLRAAASRLREIATPGDPVVTAPIYQTEPRHCPPGFLLNRAAAGFSFLAKMEYGMNSGVRS